jgi:hypothetical protein
MDDERRQALPRPRLALVPSGRAERSAPPAPWQRFVEDAAVEYVELIGAGLARLFDLSGRRR